MTLATDKIRFVSVNTFSLSKKGNYIAYLRNNLSEFFVISQSFFVEIFKLFSTGLPVIPVAA